MAASLWWREFRTYFKTIWIVIAPIILSPILLIGSEAASCTFCILLMSCYWVAEVLPLAVTSFLPVVILPFLGVVKMKELASTYITDTNFLFISSLMISLAVEECNLHKRIALKMLTYFGARPQWMMLGFMSITSFISLWISDTATAALMSPIAYSLLETIMTPRMEDPKCRVNESSYQSFPQLGRESLKRANDEETADGKRKFDIRRLSSRDRGICKCVLLIVAHASLIGGTGTINSTGPNLIFRQTLYDRYPPDETGISYVTWMCFAVPPMILYMLSSWIVVQLQFIGLSHVSRIFSKPTSQEKLDEIRAREVVLEAYDNLGPMSFAEKSTLGWFLVTVFLWITSDPKVFPGWVQLFRKNYTTDSCAGMLIVVMLFIWPKESPDFVWRRRDKERPSIRREALLDWDSVKKKFPWSVILLLGAGFAISKAVKVSGLATVIACSLETNLSTLPHFGMQILLSVVVVAMTEFSTNSATASIFIPISYTLAESVGAHPLYFSIPCAVGPSFSFMLPMATPANAIVYETGTMSMLDMALCGIFLNVFCIGITVLNMNTWAYWLFDMDTFPEYATVYLKNVTSSC